MKKLFSAKYSAGAISAAMLVLRLGLGIVMIKFGYQKLVGFSEMKGQFMNFMGMGSTVSLALVVFAEFFCSAFLILGLMTRLATIPLIITMCVVLFKVQNSEIFNGEKGLIPFLFLIGYVAILFAGPGKASVDGAISK